ncbi:lipopolysaccharide-induced tumor necrosis factor-alpha factor homolog [Schistocerca gregaria]|uniref:lipopolysaccharide-induced tumor necrosis factor-alpha factor homolog n=1 Tax=Schistocerca gregaria TaxID=7010 RepID=UPI00211E0FD0|nr:lipopolysaccharide-induced tumor necrosis factor-alpha factor homolog [Schistocerca gregaria]
MKVSKDSTPQPPPYSVVPPANSTAPYPVQPGAPTGTVAAGYPPPPGYPHSGVPVSNVIGEYPVHAAGTVIMPPLTVGPESCTAVCPACHKTVQTDVKVVSTTRTHIFALLLAMFGCCLCCCIPYCVDSLRAKHHYCPECKAFIAAYER